jgi:hypothetical protein
MFSTLSCVQAMRPLSSTHDVSHAMVESSMPIALDDIVYVCSITYAASQDYEGVTHNAIADLGS